MPRRDGTGPMGRGVLTGWGSGYCGSGVGGFPARGRGVRYLAGFCPPLSGQDLVPPSDRTEFLKQQVEYLEKRLNVMKTELKMGQEENE